MADNHAMYAKLLVEKCVSEIVPSSSSLECIMSGCSLETDTSSDADKLKLVNSTQSSRDSSEEMSSVCSSDEDDDDVSSRMNSLHVNPTAGDQHLTVNNKGASGASNVNQIQLLQHMINSDSSVQKIGHVHVENSSQVHIGNVTYLTGPIHIVHNDSIDAGIVYKNGSGSTTTHTKKPAKEEPAPVYLEEDEPEENNSQLFMDNVWSAMNNEVLRIVERRTWLAQPPLEPNKMIKGPVKYVIISHTATESADNQAGMVFLVRHIQCFHIESRRWNDIAYNFLIGGDGFVYEGRGWGRVGAHTYGYNSKAIGISFVGCFMNIEPEEISIKACKLLIKEGVRLGHIDPDYKLLAHCQCSPTESPGRLLFQKIKSWEHWSETA